jgi:uncharacterized membrane protein (UPF0127 family)
MVVVSYQWYTYLHMNMRHSIFNAKWLFIVLILFALFLFIFAERSLVSFTRNEFTSTTVKVAGIPLVVEVADTENERMLGLGGRGELIVGTGMLFKFDEEGKHQIWMKGMRFPVDVLWLSADGEVVGVKEFLTPSTYPSTYHSSEPAKYILQTTPGFIEIYNIELGSRVEL